MIDEINRLLSSFPYAGIMVEQRAFKGLRRLTYGKSRHRMLNYIIFRLVVPGTCRNTTKFIEQPKNADPLLHKRSAFS